MIRHFERRYHSEIATPDQDGYLFVVRLNFAPKSGDRRHSGIHRMVERAAPHRRSVKPEAANGGGPKGQALQTDGGEQTIDFAIRQPAQPQPARLRQFPMCAALRQLCARRRNR
jgi:hypothetical protein